MISKLTLRKKLFVVTMNVMLSVIILVGTLIIPVHAAGYTTVKVDPFSQTISSGSTFTISIACVPGQTIKSFELQVVFNPSLLKANSVAKGNIFKSYSTFFNAGSIDNTKGTITNIYDVVLGTGSTSSSGTLVTISFTAKSTSGTSSINLKNVGITNNLGYIPITITNGSIQITAQSQQSTENNLIIVSETNPSNGATNIPISTSQITITVQNTQGHTFNIAVTTSPHIGSDSRTITVDGTKSYSISGLTYDTTYQWYVSCKDVTNGQWKNQSYWFRTESDPTSGNPSTGGGSGNPSTGGGTSSNENEQPSIPEQNNPPNAPKQPTGATSIKSGVTYYYVSSASDPDNDKISLRFNWGDGTYSNWTEYVPINTNVSLSHTWSNISSYNISVIAQDEKGANSNWSDPLTIIISQTDSEEQSTVNILVSPNNISTNETVRFIAPSSSIPNGKLTSYHWEFGDGKTSTTKKAKNIYTKPGQYLVNLTITDKFGEIYTKKVILTVNSNAQIMAQNKADFMPIILIGGTIGIAIVLICALILFFREFLHLQLSKKNIIHGLKWIKQLIIKISKRVYSIFIKPISKVTRVKENKIMNIPQHYAPKGTSIKKVDDTEISYIHRKIDSIRMEY